MKSSRYVLLLFIALVLGAFGCTVMEKMSEGDVPRMGVDELKSHLNDPAFVVIDVRSYDDWKGSSVKIKGAVHELGGDESNWATKYPRDKTIVLYCA